MYKRGEARGRGHPPAPPGAPCHPFSESAQTQPCPGVVAAPNWEDWSVLRGGGGRERLEAGGGALLPAVGMAGEGSLSHHHRAKPPPPP